MKTAVEKLVSKLFDTEVPLDEHIYNAIEQAKEMEKKQQGYNEKDMISFAEFVATYPDKNKNVYGEILHAKSKYDGAERTIDLLEQFKKK
jgi:hypothetical protein